MADLEQILSNLLVPDNDVIKKATEELKNAFKREDAIPQLCTVMSTSTVPQVTLPQAISKTHLLLKLLFGDPKLLMSQKGGKGF